VNIIIIYPTTTITYSLTLKESNAGKITHLSLVLWYQNMRLSKTLHLISFYIESQHYATDHTNNCFIQMLSSVKYVSKTLTSGLSAVNNGLQKYCEQAC